MGTKKPEAFAPGFNYLAACGYNVPFSAAFFIFSLA
jgi:hypothetical protein